MSLSAPYRSLCTAIKGQFQYKFLTCFGLEQLVQVYYDNRHLHYKRSSSIVIIAAASTACGATHQRNDDRIILNTSLITGAEKPHTQAHDELITSELPFLAAVFDGVGGSVRGDKAALCAAQSLLRSAQADLPLSLSQRLDQCVFDVAHEQLTLDESKRAYTVGAGLYIDRPNDDTPPALHLFHMGDCRIYRYSHDTFELLTRDHSLAQRYRDEMGPDAEVPAHIAHVVTSYAGGDMEDPFEISSDFVLSPYDVYLICSDGFWEFAGIEETRDILAKASNLVTLLAESNEFNREGLLIDFADYTDQLRGMARMNLSHDDISLVLVGYTD